MRTLFIGDKNLSSWSLRPWLALKQAAIPFEEKLIRIHLPTSQADILTHSPSGRVPALRDGETTIWDSLAICEYAAELAPELWPRDREPRAVARSVVAEMHSGFTALREHMSMDIRGSHPGNGRTPDVEADILRITDLWRDCRRRYGAGGDFLFGSFTNADAFFAPVVTRFATYAVELDDLCAAYARSVQALPAMQEWTEAARRE